MCPYWATQTVLQEPTQQLSHRKIFGCFRHQLDSCFYVLPEILRQKDFFGTLEISWFHVFYIHNAHLHNTYNDNEIRTLSWFGQDATQGILLRRKQRETWARQCPPNEHTKLWKLCLLGGAIRGTGTPALFFSFMLKQSLPWLPREPTELLVLWTACCMFRRTWLLIYKGKADPWSKKNKTKSEFLS